MMRHLFARILAFFRITRHDADLELELEHHLAMAIEDNMREGMSYEEARRQAMIRFGGVQQARELHRTTRGLPWLDVLLQDLRFSIRTLRRDHAFTVVAVLILALGIGANVVVFSVVNTILLRPLPFPQSDRLVRIAPKVSKCGASCATYSTDAVQELQQRTRVLAEVTGYDAFTAPGNIKLISNGTPLPFSGIDVMENFFRTLGVQPMLGRDFLHEETLTNGRPVVLVSYPFWQRQLHGDANVVGRTIDLSNVPTTVIGVLPASFDFGAVYSPGSRMDLFTPYIPDRERGNGNMISITARLKQGASLADAQAEANLLFPQLDFSVKLGAKGRYTAEVYDMKDYVTGSLRRSLFVLWSAVGAILLIVCVNLSNLLLSRATARSKEFAMRSALGASRGRILRQLFTESLVLSTAGALAGLALALVCTWYLAHQGSVTLPLLSQIAIDGSALAWTVLLAIVTAAAFGVLPGLRLSAANLQTQLKDSGTGTGAGRQQNRVRNTLVVFEVALACVLLIGAGLLLRSFLRVLDVDLGFQPAHSASIAFDYTDASPTPDLARFSATLREVLRRTKALPSVEGAGITDSLPMSRNRSWGIYAKGKSYRPGELPGTFVYLVTPGYFNAMGMRLLRGRDIDWNDTDPKMGVVVVNETVARYLWPNEDPIDRIANVGGREARVIGVVADVRESSAESRAGWQMYLSALAPQFGANDLQLVVRSRVPAERLQSSVLNTLREMNPGQPIADLRPIQLLVDHSSSPRRFLVFLVGIFGGLSLLLACLGIYGVIAYSVHQRTQEIGIRMALGATRFHVQAAVLKQTLQLTLVGIVAGILVSIASAHWIRSLLYQTEPVDAGTYAAMAILLAVVAMLAGYLPARRAARIAPMRALRNN